MAKIILAGQEFEVGAPAFGTLRKMIASLGKMAALKDDHGAMMDEAPVLLSLALKKTQAEIDEMPITLKEMTDAVAIIPSICGLTNEEKPSGEAPVVVMDSTASTAT
jgi:hypothetical protein